MFWVQEALTRQPRLRPRPEGKREGKKGRGEGRRTQLSPPSLHGGGKWSKSMRRDGRKELDGGGKKCTEKRMVDVEKR